MFIGYSTSTVEGTGEGFENKTDLCTVGYMLRTKNGLLRAIFEKMLEEARPKKWIRQFREYTWEN